MDRATQTMAETQCSRVGMVGDSDLQPPLLALPSELRLQIYRHLMETGKVAHVGDPGNLEVNSGAFTNVCRTTQSDARTYEAVKARPHDKSHPLQGRHRACNASLGLQASLSLLRVSRTINSEAMGLLLGSNEFTFSHPEDMERFMKRLPLRQHCQLRHITIYVTGHQPNWGRLSYRWMFERLTGLNHANVFIELTLGHASLIKQACTEHAVHGRDEYVKSLFPMGDLPLRSVDVKIIPAVVPRILKPDYGQMSKTAIVEWEEHIKHRLLGEHV